MRGRSTLLAIVAIGLIALLTWWAVARDVASESATEPATSTVANESTVLETPSRRRHSRAAATDSSATRDALAETPAGWSGPLARGWVFDADGEPVAGARLVSYPDDLDRVQSHADAGRGGSRTYVGASAEDGSFALPVDADGVRFVLIATAEAGFGQREVGANAGDVEVHLRPWRRISGHISDASGAPIGGAVVRLYLLLDAFAEERETRSQADGSYSMARVPPIGRSRRARTLGVGNHGWLEAMAEEHARTVVPCDRAFEEAQGADVTIDVSLLRGRTLIGRVIDGDSRRPIAGARVVCWWTEDGHMFQTMEGHVRASPLKNALLAESVSGEDGRFELTRLPTPPSGSRGPRLSRSGSAFAQVAAWHNGYVYGSARVPGSEDGVTVSRDILLWPSATVVGRVVDGDGRPVSGVQVQVSVPGRDPATSGFPDHWDLHATLFPKTDANGRYRVPTLRASRAGSTTAELQAWATISGFMLRSDPVSVSTAASETVDAPDLVIDLGGLPRATLIIKDESGAAISHATVASGMRRTRVERDGRVEFTTPRRDGVDEPRLEAVDVRAEGFAAQRVEFRPARGSPIVVPVTLLKARELRGRVTTADGGVPEHATVSVLDASHDPNRVFKPGQPFFVLPGNKRVFVHGRVIVADDGSFVVADLPAGPYLVAAESTRARARREVTVLRTIRQGVPTDAEDLLLVLPAESQ